MTVSRNTHHPLRGNIRTLSVLRKELPPHLISDQPSYVQSELRSRQCTRCDAAESRNHLTPHGSSCPFRTEKNPLLLLLHYTPTTIMYHLAKSLYFYATSKEGSLISCSPLFLYLLSSLPATNPPLSSEGPSIYISNPLSLHQNKQNTPFSSSA